MPHIETMPHVISQSQDDIQLSQEPGRLCLKSIEHSLLCSTRAQDTKFGFIDNEHSSSLVTVRSHKRNVPGSSKKNKAKNNLGVFKARACNMDVATFREISCLQKSNNDILKAKKVRKHDRKRRTSDEWNGFWSRAVELERKKRRKPLTVSASNEQKKKKAMKMNTDDNPLSNLLFDDKYE